MSLSNLSIILLLSLFFSYFPSLTSSFNISQILSQYPAYSSFSNYFAQTQLADDMEKHLPVTVLVVNNSGISPLSGKPMDVIKELLSIHILLDYYDVQKFRDLHGGFAIVTTLYQATGFASGQVGFLNVSSHTTGVVTFTSHPTILAPSVQLWLNLLPLNPTISPLSKSALSSCRRLSSESTSAGAGAGASSGEVTSARNITCSGVDTGASDISCSCEVSSAGDITGSGYNPGAGSITISMILMAPGPSPVMGLPADGPPAQSGVMANSGINMALAFMVILFWTIFMQ
ncbi:hypothetical protein K1719_027795 [Acacia pycnantha]|nr:hypothetical protein K1719_027795 [Acacia pycnantha]